MPLGKFCASAEAGLTLIGELLPQLLRNKAAKNIPGVNLRISGLRILRTDAGHIYIGCSRQEYAIPY